ncbi:MAG: UPF0146 family protein [Methanomicrobiaceae archaeon]|nr:UPF0146 family protein [Methanomicrobiaceae archaeon]
MGGYKHIEGVIARYIAARYRCAIEIGVGANTAVARALADAGLEVRCTDIRAIPSAAGIACACDDVFCPALDLYRGADLLYAIRPGVEMIPPMIALARRCGADLLVYHLGNEIYEHGGEIIDCGVVLHRYVRGQNPSKRVA